MPSEQTGGQAGAGGGGVRLLEGLLVRSRLLAHSLIRTISRVLRFLAMSVPPRVVGAEEGHFHRRAAYCGRIIGTEGEDKTGHEDRDYEERREEGRE